MRPLLLIAGGLAALAASAGSAHPLAAQAPAFAGTWRLNLKDSDDPRERMERAREPISGPAVPRPFGGRNTANPDGGADAGTRPAGGRGGGGPGGGGRDACSPMARLQRPAEEITIEQTDSTLSVVAGECPPFVLYLDGRTVSEPMSQGGMLTATHVLKESKVEGDRKFGEDTSLHETYTLDAKKGRLVAEFRLGTPQLPRVLRLKLVYEMVPAG